ncbi:hypothetical protein [Luteimonas huabeiensis]|uniref:hypothetical protein n=1 Tax=Luteimonas huabeiensis TaxID=1244513 RepID=UPI0004B9D203|nr:hypothetical protein [Luteimonas huabeiensis]
MMRMALIATLLLAGCGLDNRQPTAQHGPLERATIVGSAETPDPVLARVRELEKQGVVQDVVVLESFPVQIRLLAPKAVIDELNRMPREGALR